MTDRILLASVVAIEVGVTIFVAIAGGIGHGGGSASVARVTNRDASTSMLGVRSSDKFAF